MRRIVLWTLTFGSVFLLATASGAVTIRFDLTPNDGPHGPVGVTGLGASGAFGASSPVNQVVDPANPLSGGGNFLQDIGTNLDLGFLGISCGNTALSYCDYGAPGPSEDALLFDLGGSVTMDSIELKGVSGPVDGYYWDGSSWQSFFDDVSSNGVVAGPGTSFQYLLLEMDGNDSGSSSSILKHFRVWELNNVQAAVPEPSTIALLSLAGLLLRRRR